MIDAATIVDELPRKIPKGAKLFYIWMISRYGYNWTEFDVLLENYKHVKQRTTLQKYLHLLKEAEVVVSQTQTGFLSGSGNKLVRWSAV